MRSLMRRIDLFIHKHPNFGIGNLMLYIIIGNTICYIFSLIDPNASFLMAIAFDAQAVFTRGEVWRLITFIIMPQSYGIGDLLRFVLEIYFYFFLGRMLEAAWGKGKFTIFYFSGVFFTILYGILLWLISGMGVMLFASYVNMSMFFAFATLFPDTVFLIFFIIPLKAKWIAWVQAALFIVLVLINRFPFNLLPVVAIFNYLIFCGSWLFDRMKPKNIKAKQQQRERIIKYQTAAKKYHKQQTNAPYTRKCEVCGKTDKDYPDLEFRFCSRCGGYHCFCIEHINNHVHFVE